MCSVVSTVGFFLAQSGRIAGQDASWPAGVLTLVVGIGGPVAMLFYSGRTWLHLTTDRSSNRLLSAVRWGFASLAVLLNVAVILIILAIAVLFTGAVFNGFPVA